VEFCWPVFRRPWQRLHLRRVTRPLPVRDLENYVARYRFAYSCTYPRESCWRPKTPVMFTDVFTSVTPRIVVCNGTATAVCRWRKARSSSYPTFPNGASKQAWARERPPSYWKGMNVLRVNIKAPRESPVGNCTDSGGRDFLPVQFKGG